jgi:hypothetical protein
VIRQDSEDVGRALGDEAPMSSTTRASPPIHEAGVPLGRFSGAMQDAKKETQQHNAGIQEACRPEERHGGPREHDARLLQLPGGRAGAAGAGNAQP